MKAAVYDNPNKARREFWQDGELVQWISLRLLPAAQANGAWERGPWKDGAVRGDIEAIAEQHRPAAG